MLNILEKTIFASRQRIWASICNKHQSGFEQKLPYNTWLPTTSIENNHKIKLQDPYMRSFCLTFDDKNIKYPELHIV